MKNGVKMVVPSALSAQLGVPAATASVDCAFVVNFNVELDDDERSEFGSFADYLEE